jgi:NADH-quinone oxidoreductase subunit L
VFLTFWGERRMEEHAHPDPHADPDPRAQPHSHLHDAPPAMAMALVILALGSVLAGYIGVPHALGGENRLAAWLEPAFKAPPAAEATVAGVQPSTRPRGAQSRVEGQTSGAGGFETAGQQPGEASADTHGGAALELTLMGVSTVVALVGIGLAAFLYLKRRELPAQLAERFPRLHLLLLNRYYVDELYDRLIVRPIRIASQDALWRGFDVAVIDGAVNGMGAIVSGSAWTLRRLQTGSVRAYAGSLFLGVILILGYYLWR